MFFKKGNILVPLLASIAIIAIVTAGYFFWQSQNRQSYQSVSTQIPTINPEVMEWKTITDQENGYSLKIPKVWMQVEGPPEFATTSEFRAPDGSGVRIETYPNEPGEIGDYLAKSDKISETAYEGTPSKELISTKTVFVGDYKGLKRTEHWIAAAFTTEVVYVKVDSNIYVINLQPFADPKKFEDMMAVQLFPQILSTFNFTSPKLSCPPNEKYAKGYLNCMPGPDNADLRYCNSDYQTWMVSNCPAIDIAN